MIHHAVERVVRPDKRRPTLVAAPRRSRAGVTARAATLVLALSLPQGLLALPVAVAQVGLARGLLILLLIGALNTLTIVWAARALSSFVARHGVVPSLPQLARERLGRSGALLAYAGGGALFFMALVASLVGLARSLAALTGMPAPLWGGACALLILLLTLTGTALSARLLVGLGLLNVGLVIALVGLALPHARLAPVAGLPTGSPLTMVGVGLMLFFAPMLLTPVVQLLPRRHEPAALAAGGAVGVASAALLFGLWSVVVVGVAGASELAEASGTALPALFTAAPATRLPGSLLGLLLLGMTALRCALVLQHLAREQLPSWLTPPARSLAAQLPVGLGMALALLLLTDATSYTQLIALSGGTAAFVSSVVLPGLLAWAAAVPPESSATDRAGRRAGRRPASQESGDGPHTKEEANT
jgi:amino acid permease